MRRPSLFAFGLCLLVACTSAAAQTRAEAKQFIEDNSNLKYLRCGGVTLDDTTDSRGFGRDFMERAEFAPAEVKAGGWWGDRGSVLLEVRCLTGRCIKSVEVECTHHKTWEACERELLYRFSVGKDVEFVSKIAVRLNRAVEVERIIKAWNFFVSDCGGLKKPAF